MPSNIKIIKTMLFIVETSNTLVSDIFLFINKTPNRIESDWKNLAVIQVCVAKLEPYLRIMENSDPRGWAPIPERKNEAYSAMAKIFEILEK